MHKLVFPFLAFSHSHAHFQYDGETDSRGSMDFSANAPSKSDDNGDDDDLDDDDNTELAPMRGAASRKCAGDGKLKAEFGSAKPGDLSMNVDVYIHRYFNAHPPNIKLS